MKGTTICYARGLICMRVWCLYVRVCAKCACPLYVFVPSFVKIYIKILLNNSLHRIAAEIRILNSRLQ